MPSTEKHRPPSWGHIALRVLGLGALAGGGTGAAAGWMIGQVFEPNSVGLYWTLGGYMGAVMGIMIVFNQAISSRLETIERSDPKA